MKNDDKIKETVEKIYACAKEFLEMPCQCAYTDSITELIVDYGKKLKQLAEEETNES